MTQTAQGPGGGDAELLVHGNDLAGGRGAGAREVGSEGGEIIFLVGL